MPSWAESHEQIILHRRELSAAGKKQMRTDQTSKVLLRRQEHGATGRNREFRDLFLLHIKYWVRLIYQTEFGIQKNALEATFYFESIRDQNKTDQAFKVTQPKPKGKRGQVTIVCSLADCFRQKTDSSKDSNERRNMEPVLVHVFGADRNKRIETDSRQF